MPSGPPPHAAPPGGLRHTMSFLCRVTITAPAHASHPGVRRPLHGHSSPPLYPILSRAHLRHFIAIGHARRATWRFGIGLAENSHRDVFNEEATLRHHVALTPPVPAPAPAGFGDFRGERLITFRFIQTDRDSAPGTTANAVSATSRFRPLWPPKIPTGKLQLDSCPRRRFHLYPSPHDSPV